MIDRRPSFELWSDLACVAGAVKLRNMPAPLSGGSAVFAVDHSREKYTATHPLVGDWANDLGLGRVIRYSDPLGTVSEWRVSSLRERRGRSAGSVELEADPPILDLAHIDVIVWEDGVPKANLGFWYGDRLEALDTYVLPYMPAHIDRGTIDLNDRFSLAWGNYSQLELLRELAGSRGELDFVRDGETGYLINIVSRIGADAQTVRVSVDRGNATEIRRVATLEEFATTVQILGATVPGATEQATIAEAAYIIIAVDDDTPTSGKHRIQIGPIAGGENGIGFDGQVDDQWVQFEDGQVELILNDPPSDAASGYFWVADRGTAEVNDLISFRADAAGKHIIEVSNPAALAETGGRIYRRKINLPEMRPERNYQPNPVMNEWEAGTRVPRFWLGTGGIATARSGRFDRAADIGGSFDAQYDGVHSSTSTINVKGLTPGTIMCPGFWVGLNGTTASATLYDYGVVGGDGKFTFTNDAAVTKSDGDPIRFHRPAGLFVGTFRGDNAWTVLSIGDTAADPSTAHDIAASKAVGLVHLAGAPVVHFAMGLTYETRNLVGTTLTQDSTPRPAYVWLRDESDGNVLASVQGATRVLAFGTAQHERITGSYVLTEDKTVRVVLKRPSGSLANGVVATYIRWAAIWIGTDPDTAPIIGSYATQGRDVANAELARYSQPAAYEVDLQPLAQMAGFNPTLELPTVGGEVELVGFDAAGDLRVLEFAHDLDDFARSRVRLNRVPTQVWQHLRRVRYSQPVARPVVETPDAYRAVAPVNAEIRTDPSSEPSGAGLLAVEPFDPSEFEE